MPKALKPQFPRHGSMAWRVSSKKNPRLVSRVAACCAADAQRAAERILGPDSGPWDISPTVQAD